MAAYLALFEGGYFPGVEAATCAEATGDVILDWLNPGGIGAIDVERNGLPIAAAFPHQ